MKRATIIMTVALLTWACSDDTEPAKSDKGATADKSVAMDKGAAMEASAKDGTSASGFGSTVWPTFKTSCAGSSCHGGGAGSLTYKDEAGAYAAMVGVKSTGCSSMNLVTASDATKSYLVQKLEGSGSCFTGAKMPKGGSLTTAQIASVKAWITAGAAK